MSGAQKYIQIYRDFPSQSLERKTFDLYLAMLRTLNHVVQFFAESTASESTPGTEVCIHLISGIEKLIGSMTKQETYKIGLNKSLEEVKKHASRIKETAQQCQATQSTNIDKNVIRIARKVETFPEEIAQHLYRLLQSNPISNGKGHGMLGLQITQSVTDEGCSARNCRRS